MKNAAAMERAAVLGAGTMGHGIAQVCALAGMEVQLYDLQPEALEKGLAGIRKSLAKMVEKRDIVQDAADSTLKRIHIGTDLKLACDGADVVIEAVPEVLDLKREVFRTVEAATTPDTLLASNTSSLSINDIAGVLEHRERFLGLHFFNPVPLMKLLEIVTGTETIEAVTTVARELGERLDKQPIVVRDAPGFASSRLGIAIAMEAIRMVEQNVASPEDIDRAMELGYRHPMGPLQLTDLVGLDVRLKIAEYLAETLGARFEPPQLLKDMVAQGKLGRKSGQGFYEWSR